MVRAKPHAPTSRPLGPDYDRVGLAGEEAFAARYGYPVNLAEEPDGDGGADFYVWCGTVDVKTYRIPNHLLVEAGKARATLYVLAGYSDLTGTARLIGWAWRQDVETAVPRDVGRMGVNSHALQAGQLRPLGELDRLLGAWCVGCGLLGVVGTVARRPGGRGWFMAICPPCMRAGWKFFI